MSNGDLFELDWITAPCLDMSTSIVSIYTSEGFVIAADGRNYNIETKRKISDSVKKIFPVEQRERRLVYALSGTSELIPKGATDVVFDVVAQIENAVQGLSDDTFKSLWHYAEALSKVLTDLPKQAREAIQENDPPTIIWFNGYYDGRPKRVDVKMFYDGQVPEISTPGLHHGRQYGCGSSKVLDALADNNSVLSRYRTPSLGLGYDQRTLADAIDVARSWMSAHCGPEAEGIDPICATIGGDVLMGSLTFADGFHWIPYEPVVNA